jgi:hypothetical protein
MGSQAAGPSPESRIRLPFRGNERLTVRVFHPRSAMMRQTRSRAIPAVAAAIVLAACGARVHIARAAAAEPSTLSVKSFGATGDGASDDSAAIQKAIDAAGKAGATLYFPEGSYLVRSRAKHSGTCRTGFSLLFSAKGLRIRGASKEASVIKVDTEDGHLLTGHGSLDVADITLQQTEYAQNSQWKALNID